jgi:hypothetical protein
LAFASLQIEYRDELRHKVFGRPIVVGLVTIRGIIERLSKRGLVSFSRGRRQWPPAAKIESEGGKLVERTIPTAERTSEADRTETSA